MEEVMCLEGEQQYFERYLWFYGESAIIFMYICEEWDCYSSLTTITEGGLDNVVQRRENGSARLGSARLGSARLGRSIAPFFQRVKSYFIQFVTNQLPETGRIMPWLRLFAFAGRMVV